MIIVFELIRLDRNFSPFYFRHSPFALLFTITSLTLTKSSSVIFDPEVRHNPVLKSFSLTPLTYAGQSSNTGCICIGFHRGRDSMFSFSMARRRSMGVKPVFEESMRMVVSQRLEKYFGVACCGLRVAGWGSGPKVRPSIWERCFLYQSYISRLLLTRSSMTSSCPRPMPARILLIR